jgi:tetratricopeptide (TPR) repeat protein
MCRRIQSVTLVVAAALVLSSCVFSFFFPRHSSQFCLRLKGLPQTSTLSADNADAELVTEAGILAVSSGRPDLALNHLSTAMALEPRNPFPRYVKALVDLNLGHHEQYRQDCTEAVELFDGTGNVRCPWTLAWTYCLGHNSVANHLLVLQGMEDSALEEPESSFRRLIWGAALYRAYEYEEAVARLTEAEQLAQKPNASVESTTVYTWYFLSMAHRELGHEAEATRWLDKATEWTDQVERNSKEGTVALAWNHRLTLNVLGKEAGTLTSINLARYVGHPTSFAAPR